MQIILVFVIFLYVLASSGYFAYIFFQKNRLYLTAQVLMGTSLALHTTLLTYNGMRCKTFPINNLHQILSVMVWSVSAIFFVIQRKYHLKALGVYAAPICALVMIGSCSAPLTPLHNPELFQSVWLVTHVLTIFLGYAALALACGAGILYIIQETAIKKKNRGFFFSRLPSLELLDKTGYACVVIGFSLLTVGLVTGAVYANAVWGHYWNGDPKEIWSAAAWFFYAVLLHERLAVGWRGRRSAIMTIIGFGVLLFTFLGVNFLLKGHHEPFTAIQYPIIN